MARKIAGLDIGSHSIKVTVVQERFGKIELLQFFEKPAAGDATSDGTQELIRSIFREGNINPDVVVSSVPGNTVSVHYLQIPFSDEGKIGQVVPYEVENLVPFPLEEMVVDQFILSKGNGAGTVNGSSVCVALIRKTALQSHIDTLKEAYIDPKVIELEPLALYHTFMQWYKTDETVALLDIGAARSNLCIVSKGKPEHVRTFSRGGNEVTSAIQEALAVGFDEAEDKKVLSNIILNETDTSDRNTESTLTSPLEKEGQSESDIISSAIKRGLAPLIVALQQSLHSYEIQRNENISKIYLAGGAARLSNIDRFIGNELGVEVEPLSVPQEMVQGLSGGESAGTIMPTGIGLALCGLRKKQALGLNFRKGEYFYRKEAKETKGKLLYIVIAILIVILFGSLDFYFRYHYKETRYKSIKSDIRSAYTETFPDAKNIVNETVQLKSAVEEMRKKVTAVGGASSRGITPLYILNSISEVIPEDIQVDIDDLLIDKSKIRIQGNTDSFESVERIKREFETISFFKKVEVGDAKLAADQNKVKFRLIVDM